MWVATKVSRNQELKISDNRGAGVNWQVNPKALCTFDSFTPSPDEAAYGPDLSVRSEKSVRERRPPAVGESSDPEKCVK